MTAMLQVITLEKATALLQEKFSGRHTGTELLPLDACAGHIIRQDILAQADVPGFDRSTVDGYALAAKDTFGCGSTLPALLSVAGRVTMGQSPDFVCPPGRCAEIPTGGALPAGCDAVAMLEYAEDYGDGLLGITRPAVPGDNLIFKGDDVRTGQVVVYAGTRLQAHDIGALAALGATQIQAAALPCVGILSTGDEIIPPSAAPSGGQIRDVNGPLLAAAVTAAGCVPKAYGICPDDRGQIAKALDRMAAECDVVLFSGGSSAGAQDDAAGILAQLGTVYFHGLALKPGKPTLAGAIGEKPVFCLPGHPVAAYFVFCLLVCPLLASLQGKTQNMEQPCWRARLDTAIPSNHGREECVAVCLTRQGDTLTAAPVMTKSGLITLLSGTQGFVQIPRDCEGLEKNTEVTVHPYGNLS